MMEKLITLFGVLCILLIGARGSEARAFKAFLNMAVFFLGVMLSIRYWEAGTNLLVGFGLSEAVAAPTWLATIFVTYLLIFASNIVPWLSFKAVKLEVYPVVDRILGFTFGLTGGFLVMSTVFLIASIPLIKWMSFQVEQVPYRLDLPALNVYRSVNEMFTGQVTLGGSNTFPERILIKEGFTNILPEEVGFDQRELPSEFKEN